MRPNAGTRQAGQTTKGMHLSSVVRHPFRGSRDTYAFPKMLECVAGKSGLLFALRDGDTHRFGTFIDGPITPPAEATENSGPYKVPVFRCRVRMTRRPRSRYPRRGRR